MVAIMFMDMLEDPADEPLFEQFCNRYENYVFTVCMSRMHNEDDAEECTWLTFAHAAKDFKKFEDPFSKQSKNLLCTMAISVCCREWKKNTSYEKLKRELLEDASAIAQVFSPDVEESYWRQYTVEQVAEAMTLLSDVYRPVLQMKFAHGFNAKEIASILDISHNAARQRIVKGKQLLAEILEGRLEANE